MTYPFKATLVITVLCCALTLACRKPEDEKSLVTPSVTVGSSQIEPGVLTTVHYRFTVANDAPAFPENDLVFVHAVDKERSLLWTDDHAPDPPTAKWKAGAVIEYSRQMLVPFTIPAGQATLEIGLYSPSSGTRIPMAGATEGMRAYRVATLNVTKATRVPPLFFSGWNDVESGGNRLELHWTKARSTFGLRNPRADATLILIVDQPAIALPWTQQVDVQLGSTSIDRFALAPGAQEIRRIAVSASAMGDADLTRVTISTDMTFVPRLVAAMNNTDRRELGVRFFTAYFELPNAAPGNTPPGAR